MHTPDSGVASATLALAVAALSGCADRPAATAPLSTAVVASAAPFVFPSGCCFYQGRVVRTVVPPASFPNEGLDNFYGFPDGAAAGQLGVVAVAPGDDDYHGGHWAFHAVTFSVTPYLLTSETAILTAAAAGDVTVTRVATNDFLCPIQP